MIELTALQFAVLLGLLGFFMVLAADLGWRIWLLQLEMEVLTETRKHREMER